LFTHANKVATKELEQRSSLSERRHVSIARATSTVTHGPAGDTVRGESERHDLPAVIKLDTAQGRAQLSRATGTHVNIGAVATLLLRRVGAEASETAGE